MHIALVIYGRLSTTSGGFLYDRKLVAHLRARGVRVSVVSFPWRSYGAHLWQNFSYDHFLQLVNGRFDLILQDELNHPSLFLLNRQLKQHLDCPLVSIVHHLRISERWPVWKRPFLRWVESRYLNSVDGFVFNSQTTKRAVSQLLTQPKPTVVAFPAGDRFAADVDGAFVARRAHEAGPLRLLFVGNVQQRKGVDTLIMAAARLPRDAVRLTIVGSLTVEPQYVAALQEMIAANGLGQSVTFAGKLPDEALATHFRQHHLLCVPSSYEGFGIVYLEGMGFGLPAIGTTSGAAGEIVENGRSGYLINPDDVSGLAEHLQRLTVDRALLAQMGLTSLQRFQAHPSWKTSMSKASQFLFEMAAEKRRPASSS